MGENIKGPLTEKQQRVLVFIRDFREEQGRSPTFEDIQLHFGYSSLGTVHDYISALQEKGYLTKGNRKWHNIELTENDNTLPVLGKVAAGRPLEHLKSEEKIEIPPNMRKGPGSYYALQVVGDSMINEGILEDDYVVIKRQADAENGQIVVALIDNEATIKRFFKKKGRIELISANEKYAPIVVEDSKTFSIAGVFCGLIRFS